MGGSHSDYLDLVKMQAARVASLNPATLILWAQTPYQALFQVQELQQVTVPAFTGLHASG